MMFRHQMERMLAITKTQLQTIKSPIPGMQPTKVYISFTICEIPPAAKMAPTSMDYLEQS